MLSNKYNDNNPQFNQQEKEKVQSKLRIAYFLIGLLVLVAVATYFTQSRKAGLATELAAEREAAIKELEKQLAKTNEEYNALKEQFPAKEAEIERLQNERDEYYQRLQTYIAKGGDLKKANSEIADLRKQNASLEEEIAQLKQYKDQVADRDMEIERLNNNLRNLSAENERLQRKVTELENQLSASGNTSNSGTIKNDPLPDPNGSNTNTNTSTSTDSDVSKGELKLTNIGVQVKANRVSKKDPKKKESTNKSSLAGELQICFTAAAGAKIKGNQEFIVQVTHDGKVLDSSSANLVDEYTGDEKQFCTYYKTSSFKKGTYEVTVMHNGKELGKGNTILK